MSGILSVSVVVLMVLCTVFPRSNAAVSWVTDPNDSNLELVYDNNKSTTMKWTWKDSQPSRSLLKIDINRKPVDKTEETNLVNYDKVNDKLWYKKNKDNNHETDSIYYKLQVTTNKDGKEGSAKLTIFDVKKQIDNKDGTVVNVLTSDYMYTCELIFSGPGSNPSKEIKLTVYEKPKITRPPESKYILTQAEIILSCTASGKPKPTLEWDIVSDGKSNTKTGVIKDDEKTAEVTNTLTITSSINSIGIYNCRAKNDYGTVIVPAFVGYKKCTTGCSVKEDIAIEIKNLNYNDGYGTKDSENYKKMKNDLEIGCAKLYFEKENPKVYSCEVKDFRKGSVIADIKLTFETGTSDPAKPLRDEVQKGKFAGYDVTTSFVSPTSAPTEKPTPSTEEGKPTGTGTPSAGERGSNEGLSSGAIIAIVVVFTIIFIIIIVVLIVCMVKRRKPAGSSKPYKEDGAYKATTATPLKAQPYKEDPYDNASDDRYPNGGGPPPQYTPSSNYAEVQPSPGEQDESQVEWDKSVKDEMWI